MTFKLPELPYAKTALQPHVSAETLGFHHDKHHRSYVDKLNDAIAGTGFADLELEEVVSRTAGASEHAGIFNNAAQTWNHDFLWQSMSPDGGGKPDGELARQIDADFGSFDKFRSAFIEKGTGQFGSGWVWLVVDGGNLAVVSTPNADTPLAHGLQALLTCDVWEHAYYLDYQNRRQAYLECFVDNLANWSFAAGQFANQGEGNRTASRRFRDAQEEFAASGDVAEAANAAKKALDGPDADKLERARRAAASGSR